MQADGFALSYLRRLIFAVTTTNLDSPRRGHDKTGGQDVCRTIGGIRLWGFGGGAFPGFDFGAKFLDEKQFFFVDEFVGDRRADLEHHITGALADDGSLDGKGVAAVEMNLAG